MRTDLKLKAESDFNLAFDTHLALPDFELDHPRTRGKGRAAGDTKFNHATI